MFFIFFDFYLLKLSCLLLIDKPFIQFQNCYFYHFLLFKFDAHFLQTHPYGFPWRRYFAQSEHTNLSHTTHTSSLSINVFFRQDIHNAYPSWLNTLLLIPIFSIIPYFFIFYITQKLKPAC